MPLLTDEERLQFRVEPTPEVVQAARDTILQHELSIEAIEERIQGLLVQVRDLRYDQAKHRAAIERCSGILTLARRLPAELLIKIFMHCVEDGWTPAPLVVSHVCSAWRNAALSPKVWSHVYVRCDDANVLDRTQFWLKMASTADLHITFAASWRITQREINRLMALLTTRRAQWRSLRIETETTRHAESVLAQCRGVFPELRELSVKTSASTPDGSEVDGTSDLELLLEIFNAERAPRLATVSYVSVIIPAVPIFPVHIRHLDLRIQDSLNQRPLSTDAILSILEPLTELTTLTFSMPFIYIHPFVPEPDSTRVVSLPNLTSLTVYGPTDLNELLPHIHAPLLRRIHLRSLEDLGYRQQPVGPSLMRFLDLSSPPIELLDLHDIDFDPETFAACFTALPDLRELRLHESSISDSTIQLLNGPRGLCPRLRKLDLRWCGMLRGRTLVDLVQSRLAVDELAGAASDSIEEVGVINCAFVLEDDVLDLARMTVCRIVTRDGDDYCRSIGCCSNARYRTRLRLRHMDQLAGHHRDLRLVL
ncbi:hypothetical protein K466DRAFT_544287 [Polyporus arcularius HHB13444]|uniref:F-box domain-containing protein n=1 Tax=Polyporus arcularius HHB13444 TaxID=1314778 RepID=A0A5C3PLG8_9APHY|nr:hypothetical protein K466DRAFT_544287 [Polyporus arcularius HHB13444]